MTSCMPKPNRYGSLSPSCRLQASTRGCQHGLGESRIAHACLPLASGAGALGRTPRPPRSAAAAARSRSERAPAYSARATTSASARERSRTTFGRALRTRAARRARQPGDGATARTSGRIAGNDEPAAPGAGPQRAQRRLAHPATAPRRRGVAVPAAILAPGRGRRPGSGCALASARGSGRTRPRSERAGSGRCPAECIRDLDAQRRELRGGPEAARRPPRPRARAARSRGPPRAGADPRPRSARRPLGARPPRCASRPPGPGRLRSAPRAACARRGPPGRGEAQCGDQQDDGVRAHPDYIGRGPRGLGGARTRSGGPSGSGRAVVALRRVLDGEPDLVAVDRCVEDLVVERRRDLILQVDAGAAVLDGLVAGLGPRRQLELERRPLGRRSPGRDAQTRVGFQPRSAASWRTTSAALSVRVSTVNLPCWVRVLLWLPIGPSGKPALGTVAGGLAAGS